MHRKFLSCYRKGSPAPELPTYFIDLTGHIRKEEVKIRLKIFNTSNYDMIYLFVDLR